MKLKPLENVVQAYDGYEHAVVQYDSDAHMALLDAGWEEVDELVDDDETLWIEMIPENG